LSLRPERCSGQSERWGQPRETLGHGPECSESGEEIDEIAARCGLTPTERAVLTMARLQRHTPAEIAAELGLTPRQVSETLVDALRKARTGFERAASPRALFWEEVRQKARCIYRRRRVRWIR
jgi:DNA-directed RNA polymerase specialized sigma24 family protein